MIDERVPDDTLLDEVLGLFVILYPTLLTVTDLTLSLSGP